MKIEKQLTDAAILKEIGERTARRRLDLQLSQADLAEEAGLSKRTVERMEAGESAQLSSMIRVLRALNLMDKLDGLIPEVTARPMELLKLKGKLRKRASSARKADKSAEEWRWGDEE